MKTVCKKLLSVMLVAILLVSALPFQAFADDTELCRVNIVDANGAVVWAHDVPAGSTIAASTPSIPTANAGVNNKTGYTATGKWIVNGTVMDDDYLNNDLTINAATEVKAEYAPNKYTLTLNASENGGKIGENDSTTRTVAYDAAVGTIDAASKANYTFIGWFPNADGTGEKLTSNTVWKTAGDATYYACFEPNLNSLTISKIKVSNGTQISNSTVDTVKLMEDVKLLNYLENVWTGMAIDEGYEWDEMWYNNAASTPLTSQSEFNNANRAVFYKLTAKAYTLSFDAKGGTVNPTAKVVYYDSAVGELPTPSCDGKVFSHWEDEAGNKVTASTIYKTAGNSKLEAVYIGEIKVNLHMHTEKSKTGGLIAPLSGYVAGDDITQTIAMNVVKNYYSGNMTFVGLFNTDDWNQYVEGKNPTGKNFVEIPEGTTGTYTIHVMINNGTLGTSGSNSGSTSTTPTTKPADKTNPATGDGIFAVMSVMMGSGAAVLSLNELRKRNKI